MSQAANTKPWFELLLVCGSALLMTGALAARTAPMTRQHPAFAAPGDHHKYVFMAETGPFSFHIAPFCWRPGVPWLARAMSLDAQSAFFMITFLSIAGNAVAVYYLSRAFGCGQAAGLFGMATFFSLGYATKYALLDFWLPDPAAMFLVTLALWCVLRRRPVALAVLLALGVLVKESVIFVAPLYWTLRPTQSAVDDNSRKIGQSRRLARAILPIMPAALLLVVLRVGVPAKNHDPGYVGALPERVTTVDPGTSSYRYGEQFQRLVQQRWSDLSRSLPESIHSYSVGSLGVIAVLFPFFAVRRNASLLVRLLPFLLLVYGQLLFATDTQRLLVLAFPALLLMELNGLNVVADYLRVPAAGLLPLPAMVAAASLWNAHRVAGPSSLEALLVACCLGGLCLFQFARFKLR